MAFKMNRPMVEGSGEHNSALKQLELGGTESGKGNIFTSRGRKQRRINKLKKSEQDYLDAVNFGDAEEIEKQRKKTFKRIDKFKKKYPETYDHMNAGGVHDKTVIMDGDKDVTSDYIILDSENVLREDVSKWDTEGAIVPVTTENPNKKNKPGKN
tara:strand:- start:220 stop:684 length:465 start_codon:yes stop_codon:yes gene_type:complete